MQVHTYDDIMALKPCFDPAARGYCTRDWQGTALDVLRHSSARAQDKLWLVLRESWIPAPVLHEFACRCAERALALVDTPDPRSVAAIATKRAWLRGEATDDELAAAQDAALAAWAAARDAAWAAWDAAWDAAWAAQDAAQDAAWDAAWAAALAAQDAAFDAAWVAEAAGDAEAAARDAAQASQVDMLIALLTEDEYTVALDGDGGHQTQAGASGMAYAAGAEIVVFRSDGGWMSCIRGVSVGGNAYETDDFGPFGTAAEAEVYARDYAAAYNE